MSSKPVVAMALGGLGGFNAHDAGVLAAAHECGLEPDIITCTSGAIFWTDLFLTDPGAVRAALWLSLYGFANRYAGETAIDGAYERQLIMSELTRCDVIYAIKPQASAWRARPPGNYRWSAHNPRTHTRAPG